jgi:hypothetical protein
MLLMDVAATLESGNNAGAIRFEPAMFGNAPSWAKNQLAYIHAANPWASPETGLMIACTSWGKFQLLGANIYAFGFFKFPIADFLANEAEQELVYGDFIAPHDFHPHDDVTQWGDNQFTAYAAFYNGPGAVDAYVAAMHRVIAAGPVLAGT